MYLGGVPSLDLVSPYVPIRTGFKGCIQKVRELIIPIQGRKDHKLVSLPPPAERQRGGPVTDGRRAGRAQRVAVPGAPLQQRPPSGGGRLRGARGVRRQGGGTGGSSAP